jgi:hypothetical protein
MGFFRCKFTQKSAKTKNFFPDLTNYWAFGHFVLGLPTFPCYAESENENQGYFGFP